MSLPYDTARCPGIPGESLCQQCRRTEPGHPTAQWKLTPQFGYGMEGQDECPNFEPKEEA